MSNAAMDWAWNQRVDPDAKLVLLALAHFGDEAGVGSPRETAIMDATSLPVGAIKAALARMQRMALIHVERRGSNPALISLNLTAGSERAETSP